MTRAVMTPRRLRWLALLTVTGVVAGAYAARRSKSTPVPAEPVPALPLAPPAPPPGPSAASRSLVRMAAGGGIAVLLAVAVAVAARPPDDPAPEPVPADLILGSSFLGDIKGATLAEPINLSTGGRPCLTGAERPVLDTVYPALSASFTGAARRQYVEPAFQVEHLPGFAVQDGESAGDPVAVGETATLDLRRRGPLTLGASYRWRVRGAPAQTPGDDGWSPWCEFTIAASTPDGLALDEGRTYTVALSTANWQAILRVLGPVEVYAGGGKSVHAPIEDAAKTAAAQAPVAMDGSRWKLVVSDLASLAADRDPAAWSLVDLLSTALGGPPRLTMGYPRD
jgi:hypothetical protein